MISYTETYNGDIALLGMSSEMDRRLRRTLDDLEGNDRERWNALLNEIDEAVTQKIQEHGVDTETGEWCGDWSAEGIVRAALDRAAHPA